MSTNQIANRLRRTRAQKNNKHDMKTKMRAMKIILLYLVFESSLIGAAKPAQAIQVNMCEDVLTPIKCKKLRREAQDINLTDSDIVNGLRDALLQTDTPEIDTYAKVIEYLDDIFMCRIHYLSPKMCTKLLKIASIRQIPFHNVYINMVANRARGKKHREQLYAAVIKYISNSGDQAVFHDDTPLVCADVLSEEMCEKLNEKAASVHLLKMDVMEGLTDAKLQGVLDPTSLYKKAEEYLTSLVECVGILDHEHCGAIKLIARNEKVPFREVERLLKLHVTQGITEKNVLYRKAMEYLNTADDELLQERRDNSVEVADAITAACLRVLSAKKCKDLETFAQLVFVDRGQVAKALTDAELQGVVEPVDVFKKAKQFLEDQSYCQFVMDDQKCKDIQKAAEANNFPLHAVRAYIVERKTHGVNDGDKLFAMTMKHIDESTRVLDESYADESECHATTGNQCMSLLNSIHQCLLLKIFGWKAGLKPADVSTSLQEACAAGGIKNLYKNTAALLRCRYYCRIGRANKSCKNRHNCAKKSPPSIVSKPPRKLIIGINGKK